MAHVDCAGAERDRHPLSSLTSFNTRRVSAKTHRKLVEGWVPSGPAPSIDVFLPTYGEDVAVLRNTYTHVKAMEWVGKVDVHVLDDGDRGEVGELAAESASTPSCDRIVGT